MRVKGQILRVMARQDDGKQTLWIGELLLVRNGEVVLKLKAGNEVVIPLSSVVKAVREIKF